MTPGWIQRLRRLGTRQWRQFRAAFDRQSTTLDGAPSVAASRREGEARQRFWSEVQEGRRLAAEHEVRTAALAKAKP